jgi:hypothetical protein
VILVKCVIYFLIYLNPSKFLTQFKFKINMFMFYLYNQVMDYSELTERLRKTLYYGSVAKASASLNSSLPLTRTEMQCIVSLLHSNLKFCFLCRCNSGEVY